MQHPEEQHSSKGKGSLDPKSAARTPSSPATLSGSPVPWHGRPASPAFVSALDGEEAYHRKKESSFDAQRPPAGARKWTISPLNRAFSGTPLDAAATSSGNVFENPSTAFSFSSGEQSLLSSGNSTSSSSSLGYSDVSDTDTRNETNVSGTSSGSLQLSQISIGRSWEEAFASQNIQHVQQLLKCGFSASGEGAQMKRPPLILAVLTGDGTLVKLLLTAGADINCVDSESFTALHHAAAAGDRNIVKLLLVAGADLYTRTKQGLFPMHLAIDGPTHQLLSQRLKSDMKNPVTQPWIDLPNQSSSGNLIEQLDPQPLTGPSALPPDDFQNLESASFANNENQRSSDTLVEGPMKGPVFLRRGSFGQSDLEDGLDTELFEGRKVSVPASSTAVFSNQDVGASIPANDVESKDFKFNEDWISSFLYKDTFEKGKQPIGTQNVWLQNLLHGKGNSQDTTKTAMGRNQDISLSGGAAHGEGKGAMGKYVEGSPQKALKDAPQNSMSASAADKLQEQPAALQTESLHPNKYVQEKRMGFGSMMDGIFKDQEDSLSTSRALDLKSDQKSVPNNTASGFITQNPVMKPTRSESGVSDCASSSFEPISGRMNESKNQGMPCTIPLDTPCSSNSGQLIQRKDQITERGRSAKKEAPEDCRNNTDNTVQSNVLSEGGVDKTLTTKLQEEDAKPEGMSKPLPAHRDDSHAQNQGKFIPPLEADLALVRKDWHDAARAGCVGCGAEGCGGECLPKTAYGNMNREKPSNEPSSSKSKKTFKKAQMKKTKNFEWKRGELLGEGAYGKVFCGLNQSTGELMAVKQLKFHNLNDDEEKDFYMSSLEREITLYKEMRHKHIVGYIDMDKDDNLGYLYIFLEYVSGGSIQSMLERFGPFSEPLVRVYTRQLLLGLEYLHKNRIVHRDIKGGNVLVDSDGVVKLADFGASKAFHEATITDACKSIRGSVFWMAPEVIKGDNYGRHADMWSVGCTVIEMLTAMHPWPGIDNTWAAIFQIAKASSGPPIPETASDCAKDFLARCFSLNPKMRASASQLLEHPFVAKAPELDQGVTL